jgi:hypothetical protein
MSRPWRTRVVAGLWAGAGFLLITAAAGADVLRHRPFAFGDNQAIIGLAGALALVEGLLQLRGTPFPALGVGLGREGRSGTVLAFGIAGLLLLVQLWLFRVLIVDDSFITFRFARSLAEGAGLAWNPHEPPVEGYSNFLWMLVSAASLRMGLDPFFVARVVSIVCLALTLVAVHALARRVSGSSGRANLSVVLFAAIPAFAYWAMSGLETASIVLLAVLYVLAIDVESERTWPWRSALVADLLLLSRPDTPLLVALPLIIVLLRSPRERSPWVARLAAIALPAAIVYLGWKLTIFHRLFPNTVAAKFQPGTGMSIVSEFWTLVFPLAIVWIAARRRPHALIEHQVAIIAVGVSAALLNVVAVVAHFYRFFLPVLGMMTAIAPAYLPPAAPFEGTQALSRRGALIFAAVLMFTLAPLLAMVEYAKTEGLGLEQAHLRLARILATHYDSTGVLVASDCGVMPYVTRMRTIDLFGLTDRHIAEHGLDVGYVMKARPNVVVLNSLDPDEFRGRGSYDIKMHEALRGDRDYQVTSRWRYAAYWLWVYERRPG